MLIALKQLKVRTSNLAGVFPGIVPTWPLTNVFKKWAWSRSRDPVNFWALNANSSKTAVDTNFKFGRHVPRDSPNMTPDKSFRCGRDQGHVTTTTVPCKLQQWDRYRVPPNVFLFCNNFVFRQPVFIIIGTCTPEELYNRAKDGVLNWKDSSLICTVPAQWLVILE